MKKILKLTFILFLVCAVTAGILGGVNEITKDRIELIQQQKTAAAYSNVLPAPGFKSVEFDRSDPAYKTIDSISEATDGSGWVIETTFSGAQGNITMAVGIDKNYECTGISIINHSETSGLGANAASTAEVGVNFRNQFIGQGGDVALSKAGGEIDALSGATITSRSITSAVALAIAMVETLG